MDATPGQRPAPPTRYRVLICFLVGLLGLDGLVRLSARLWDAYEPNDYAERLHRCRNRAWDVVVIGGSPVSEGVDPSRFRPLVWRGRAFYRIYNLGLPGGTASEFWHALRHGVTVPPKLVVYGITASDLNDNRNEGNGPATLMGPGDVVRWAAERPGSREWLLRQYGWACLDRCWGLYQYRNAIRLWAARQADGLCPGLFPAAVAEADANLRYSADLARGDGFAPQAKFQTMRYSRTKAAGEAVAPFRFLDGYRLGHHLECVFRIRAWAERQGAELVLVDMPVTADLEARHAGAFARYHQILRDLEQRHGFRVLHGDRVALGLGDEYFADLIHLNDAGSNSLSCWLRGALYRAGGGE